MKVVIEGKIKGKARPRFSTKTGRAYTPNDTVSYENWVKLCYKEQSNKYFEGALKVDIEVFYPIPKSYSKKKVKAISEGLEYPTKKPDIDNIVKIILDSLNGIAFKDDSQVTDLVVSKRYTLKKERVVLEIKDIMQQNRQSTTI